MDAKQPDGAGPGGARGARADGGQEAVTAEQLWTKYAARLTSIVVRYLRADYWHMPQARPLTCLSLVWTGIGKLALPFPASSY